MRTPLLITHCDRDLNFQSSIFCVYYQVLGKRNTIHAFADDTQLYRHCFRDEMAATGVRPKQCLEEVSHWMSANRHNADKTDLLWAGSTYSQLSLGSKGLPLQIDSDTITASDHVRVLGVTFSADLSRDKHVFSICALCFFWLRQLRRVRRSLDDESVKTLVHTFCDSSS